MTDWVHIMIEMPALDANALIAELKAAHGFEDIDCCELQRYDFSRVSYGPCPERTSSGYGEATDKKLRGY
jgi:hypothetical protein